MITNEHILNDFSGLLKNAFLITAQNLRTQASMRNSVTETEISNSKLDE